MATVYFDPEKFESEKRVKGWLEGISAEIEEQVRQELAEIMERVRDRAIELCPKHSGALASSIELSTEGGSGTVGAQGNTIYEASIYAGNDSTFNEQGQPTSQYASIVHEGTATKEPHPFLTDAMMEFEAEIEAVIEKVLRENGWNLEESE